MKMTDEVSQPIVPDPNEPTPPVTDVPAVPSEIPVVDLDEFARPPRKKSRKRLFIGVGAGVAALAIVGAVVLVNANGGPAPLREAFDECNGMTGALRGGVEIADEDRTLALDMKGEDDAVGTDITTIACVLNSIDTPTRVINLMDSTRAMDGRQTDSWENDRGRFTATWSYHPNTGMNVLLVHD